MDLVAPLLISRRVSAERSLVVVDSRSNQWEELSRDLPDNTELLVLDDDRIFLEHRDSAYSIGSADGDIISFGSLELDAALGTQISLIQQSELVADDVNLQLYAAPFVGRMLLLIELLEVLASLKGASLRNGTLKLAANAAFS